MRVGRNMYIHTRETSHNIHRAGHKQSKTAKVLQKIGLYKSIITSHVELVNAIAFFLDFRPQKLFFVQN